MDSVTVKITNWEKYNPKSFTVRYPLWFKLSNNILASESLFGLDASSRLAFIYFLSIASKQRSDVITFKKQWFEGLTALDRPLDEIIEILKERELLCCFESSPIDRQSIANEPPIDRQSIANQLALREEKKREEEKRKERERESIRAPSGAPSPADLVSIWNDLCGTLPKAVKFNKARQAKWVSRFKENPDLEYWVQIVKRIAASNFCNGSSTRGWRATIDWLLQPDTHLKVLEGKYDNTELRDRQIKNYGPNKDMTWEQYDKHMRERTGISYD